MKVVDVLVIGAGQAGLAMGYHLQQSNLSFVLVDRGTRIGDSWRGRYDSLLLFTPRSLSALPGLLLEGNQQGYAHRDEFADYLEKYTKKFQLPIAMNTRIMRLVKENGKFSAFSADGEPIHAKAVVIASGGFQKPIIPEYSHNLSGKVRQFSAEDYRNPGQVPGGTVAVIGDGATGRDIANELAGTHTVYLATGNPRRLLPERILGVSMWWWLKKFGFLTAPTDSFIGRKMRAADAFPDRDRSIRALRRKGIRVMPRLTRAHGETVDFANGENVRVESVIWAVGYRDDVNWVAIPRAVDTDGYFIHHQGISPVEKLYFIGRPWQTSRASSIICGVDADARLILDEIQRNDLS